MFSTAMSTTEAHIIERIEASKKAGLSEAVKEEEAKLAELRTLPGMEWSIEDWYKRRSLK